MNPANHVLLTVSGTIPDQLEADTRAGKRPEADYVAMAKAFRADLLDYSKARDVTGQLGAFVERFLGPNAVLACACFMLRDKYQVIFTDGEQVGLPLALLLKYFANEKRRPSHLMIVHILSVRKKTLLVDGLGLHTHIDKFLVYSRWQADFIKRRWKLSSERVVFTPFMVDTNFFSPAAVARVEPAEWLAQLEPPIVCSVGLEHRDYPTLIEAVRGLNVRVIIAAASPWSKRADTTEGQAIPNNVVVRKFSQYELRSVYAASAFLVMPLFDVDFQAGVTAILEAMAMGKAVVCTKTRGQTDVVRDEETGVYVAPGDVLALRKAIERLLEHPDEAARMGRAGQEIAQTQMSLARYVQRLTQWVESPRATQGAPLDQSA